MKTRAEFHAFVAEVRAKKAALEERARPLATLPGVRFHIPGRDRRLLASVDTNPGGRGWRLTHFDDLGPIGHQEHPSLLDAIVEALRVGGEPVEPNSSQPT